ncbi:phosphoglycerate mutase [Lysinibacillus sp. FJAT-14745]|nr:histidine phosphatase family protein [Lysinibacillus sp. FJAT-14745]KOP70344.1 phosphoglycerate mutase [Lysinibacillus sp. FJAT-14745]
MELIFIRHGQGEHTMDLPSSLQVKDPSLTAKGVKQVKLLRNEFPLTNNDVIFISPTRRTLQTAFILSENIDCLKIVSPFVSPRVFPIFLNKKTLPCDEIMDFERIKREYPAFEVDLNVPNELWNSGINIIPENNFIKLAEEFIANCKLLQKEKIFIVSHDGTITSYRQWLSGQTLSRKDFPYETGWFRVSC